MTNDLYIIVSPTAVLAGFMGLIVLVSLSFLGGVWAGRPQRDTPTPTPPPVPQPQSEPGSCARAECADTVEMSAEDRRIAVTIPAPRRPVDEPTKVLPR